MEKLDAGQCAALLDDIERAMRDETLTNEEVAERAGIDEGTVRNVRNGKSRVYATFEKICVALNIPIKEVLDRHRAENSFSSSQLGGYRLQIFSLCLGSFTTLRPDADERQGAIERYRTDIWWDEKASCFAFKESCRRAESGQIYIPPSSAFLYLMTIRDGYVRTVIASTMHYLDREMYGIELAQLRISAIGNNYTPVIRPIVFMKDDEASEMPSIVHPGDQDYERYRQMLLRANDYVGRIEP